MNTRKPIAAAWRFAFRVFRASAQAMSGGQIAAFGAHAGGIGGILVINLERQPRRFRRTMRELARFRIRDGAPLTTITKRLTAIDAYDGRAIAATADVDPIFRIGDQLHVQPNARLEECFGADQRVRMTPQEIAVARSHIEAWKVIAAGVAEHVLVLEDDVWFRRDAARLIDRAWRDAVRRCGVAGPQMLYLSYEDAGGTCERTDAGPTLFRPVRGLWFMSGYVLSRSGAAFLLRSMPVVGPVDMWINGRFDLIRPLAMNEPAILQRPDAGSDNAYSVLPFLAQAGVIDADAVRPPQRSGPARIMAWTEGGEHESLAMALSTLGLRTLVFDDAREIDASELHRLFGTYDALVNVPLSMEALVSAAKSDRVTFVLEPRAQPMPHGAADSLPCARTVRLPDGGPDETWWAALCAVLGIPPPIHAFPAGTPRSWRLFRGAFHEAGVEAASLPAAREAMDDTAWAMSAKPGRSGRHADVAPCRVTVTEMEERLTRPTASFLTLTGTFPGNRAMFDDAGVGHGPDGATLTISRSAAEGRPYRSGALVSDRSLLHGRCEIKMRAARGSGLVTGFFLYRSSPRQEIDIEVTGDDPRSLLVNVFFNPGDEGTALNHGYRGSPARIDLGFDASEGMHDYAMEWHPDGIVWQVDGVTVHKRGSWDPTPIPYLPMKLYANLWAPRATALAGSVEHRSLPSSAIFSNVAMRRFVLS